MAEETTPLLASNDQPEEPTKTKLQGAVWRILLCAFLISLSFSFTQVPILYVFRLMTCEEYYKLHDPSNVKGDRCNVNAIESSTARSVSLLGSSTTIFGVLNLLITGALIKRVGVHLTLVAQTFWPSVRLCCQLLAVTVGGNTGIWIFQVTQAITIVGGPAGYLLVLNSYVTEIATPAERTGVFGRLQGCVMFGGAFGFILGGLAGDVFGIRSPFMIALGLMVISTFYSAIFLPYIKPSGVIEEKNPSKNRFAALLGPTRVFSPQLWRYPEGRVRKHHGAGLLALGVYLGTVATGYIPTLIQMYSTGAFGFGPTENGFLMSCNALIRGLFLSLAFPRIISAGREWFARRGRSRSLSASEETARVREPLLAAEDLEVVAAPEIEQEPAAPMKAVSAEEGSAFDLFFLRWSLVVDGILTGLATFTRHGWQIYLVAFILPLASGSASAAKSVMIEMCPKSQKADALSAITLVEMTAMLSTLSIFGAVFASLAEVGKTHLTFACNAGIAIVAVGFLVFCHFPPLGSTRVSDEQEEENVDGESEEVSEHNNEDDMPANGK
ncbi:hypothetical protein AAFC00_003418 [Neodothiora populina]|uniref:Major facilitator superfamily transporter n=1 Tax=Neodothiora populina TaxID=2781224 RepID=A0ABR3PFA5_9PEZI